MRSPLRLPCARSTVDDGFSAFSSAAWSVTWQQLLGPEIEAAALLGVVKSSVAAGGAPGELDTDPVGGHHARLLSLSELGLPSANFNFRVAQHGSGVVHIAVDSMYLTVDTSAPQTEFSYQESLWAIIMPIADAPLLVVDLSIEFNQGESGALVIDQLAPTDPSEVIVSLAVKDLASSAVDSIVVTVDGGSAQELLTGSEALVQLPTTLDFAAVVSTPPDFIGVTSFIVEATSQDGSDLATTAVTVTVTVNPVELAPPTLVLTNTAQSAVSEGGVVEVVVSQLEAATVGAVTALSVDIPSGFPVQGVTVDNGSNLYTGAATVPLVLLPPATVRITPAATWSGEASVPFTATSTLDGNSESTVVPAVVSIAAVATMPSLSSSITSGQAREGQIVNLAFTVGAVDVDGSETMTAQVYAATGVIDSLASGQSCVESGGDPPTQTVCDLGPVTTGTHSVGVQLPHGPLSSATLHVSVTSTEVSNGDSAVASVDVPFTITVEVTAPVISGLPGSLSGLEDEAAHIEGVTVVRSTNSDVGESTHAVLVVSGLPDGVHLDGVRVGGSAVGRRDLGVEGLGYPASTQVYDLPVGGSMGTIELVPPAGWSGEAVVEVLGWSEQDGSDPLVLLGSVSSLAWSVTGVATPPSVSLGLPATPVSEDVPFVVTVTAGLSVADGSESLSVSLGPSSGGSGSIAGMSVGGVALVFLGSVGGYVIPSVLFPLGSVTAVAVTVTTVPHFSGNLELRGAAVSTQLSNGDVAEAASVLVVSVAGVGDQPSLAVVRPGDFATEDVAMSWLVSCSLVDVDGSESLGLHLETPGPACDEVSISFVGVGVVGQTVGDACHFAAPASALLVQPVAVDVTPRQNLGGVNVTIDVVATAVEVATGDDVQRRARVPIKILAVADEPTLVAGLSSGDVTEGQIVNVSFTVGAVDVDGSETMTALVSAATGVIDSLASGQSCVESGGDPPTQTVCDLGPVTTGTHSVGVQLPHGPLSSATLHVSVTSTEVSNGDSAVASVDVPFSITVEVTAPVISGLPGSLSGLEDEAAHIEGVTVVRSTNSDVGESTHAVLVVSGLPDGVHLDGVRVGGSAVGRRDLGVEGLGYPASTQVYDLPVGGSMGTIELVPPTGWSGEAVVDVLGWSEQDGSDPLVLLGSVSSLAWSVAGVADQPTIVLASSNFTTVEDTAASVVVVSVASVDVDGSELVQLELLANSSSSVAAVSADGVPVPGVVVDNVTAYSVPLPAVGGPEVLVEIFPRTNSDAPMIFTLRAVTSEDGTSSEFVQVLTIPVVAVADAPSVTIAGPNDPPLAGGVFDVTVTAGLTDVDGSESLAAWLSVQQGTAASISSMHVGPTLLSLDRDRDAFLVPATLLVPNAASGATFVVSVLPKGDFLGQLDVGVYARATDGPSSSEVMASVSTTVVPVPGIVVSEPTASFVEWDEVSTFDASAMLASVDVALASQPTHPVEVAPTVSVADADSNVTVEPSTLHFNASNWNTPQTLVLSATPSPGADVTQEKDQPGKLRLPTNSSDAAYDTASPRVVIVGAGGVEPLAGGVDVLVRRRFVPVGTPPSLVAATESFDSFVIVVKFSDDTDTAGYGVGLGAVFPCDRVLTTATVALFGIPLPAAVNASGPTSFEIPEPLDAGPLCGWRAADKLVVFMGHNAAARDGDAITIRPATIRGASGRTPFASGSVSLVGRPAPPTLSTVAFLSTGAGLEVGFEGQARTLLQDIGTECSGYFANGGVLGIGASCTWVRETAMDVALGQSATLVPATTAAGDGCSGNSPSNTGGSLSLKPFGVDPAPAKCAPVASPPNPPVPVPIIVAPTTIGSCDTLVLDSTQSTGGAGRTMDVLWEAVAMVAGGNIADGPGAGSDLSHTAEFVGLVSALSAASAADDEVVSIPSELLPLDSITTFKYVSCAASCVCVGASNTVLTPRLHRVSCSLPPGSLRRTI